MDHLESNHKKLRFFLIFLYKALIRQQISQQGSIECKNCKNFIEKIKELSKKNFEFSSISSTFSLTPSYATLSEVLTEIENKNFCQENCFFDDLFFVDILKEFYCKCEQQNIKSNLRFIKIYPGKENNIFFDRNYAICFKNFISADNFIQETCDVCEQVSEIHYKIYNSPSFLIFECRYDETKFNDALRLFRSIGTELPDLFLNSKTQVYSLCSLIFSKQELKVIIFYYKDS